MVGKRLVSFAVLVKVQVTVSPSSRLMVAVAPDVVEAVPLPSESTQATVVAKSGVAVSVTVKVAAATLLKVFI